jgi:hypothetical protein
MSPAQRAGVVTFAGVLFIIVAAFNVIDGLAALLRPEKLYVGENALVVTNYDALGIGLLVGAGIMFLVGWGILAGSQTARVLGIVMAGLSFLAQLAFFRHYPAWAATIMVLDVVIIYGLVVHAEDFGRRRRRV